MDLWSLIDYYSLGSNSLPSRVHKTIEFDEQKLIKLKVITEIKEMFPWLKGEPERLPANGFRNRPEPSGAKNIRSMEVGANR